MLLAFIKSSEHIWPLSLRKKQLKSLSEWKTTDHPQVQTYNKISE